MLEHYLTYVFDTAHFFELFFLAASWSMLENKPWRGLTDLKKTLVELACLFAVMFFCDAWLTGHTSNYLLVFVLAQGVISAVFVFAHPRERCLAGLALWCSMYAGSISLTAIGGQMSIILASVSAPGSFQGLVRAFFDALGIPLAVYLNAKSLDRYDRIPPGGLTMVLAGDLCLFLIRFLESRSFTLYANQAVILAGAYFCVLILVLCAVYAVNSICREQARSLEYLAARQRAEGEKDLIRLTEKQLDDLRQLRHDIKNQYSYMRILLAEKRYDELEEYFQRQDGELAVLAAPLDCGNRCVSIILNMERQKAESAGVSFRTKLVVPPVLPFPDEDMCSLLSNLLDNAIDECVRLGTYFPRFKEQGVSVSINPGNPSSDYLYIDVKNPTDRKTLSRRADGIASTKDDATLHGYGTRIITRIAEKYNGYVLFEAADGVFTARVLLDMMGKKEAAT